MKTLELEWTDSIRSGVIVQSFAIVNKEMKVRVGVHNGYRFSFLGRNDVDAFMKSVFPFDDAEEAKRGAERFLKAMRAE